MVTHSKVNSSSPDLPVPEKPQDDSEFVAELTAVQGLLQGYLVTLLPGDSEIKDILQRTNLVLWNKKAEFEPGTNFRSWACQTAYWEARSWMTTRKREAWLLYDEELVQEVTARFTEPPVSEEDDTQAHDTTTALRRCLAKLRESDRLAVVYYYQHGKSLAECERVLGRRPNSLKVSLFRIRGALRRCIKANLALTRSHQA